MIVSKSDENKSEVEFRYKFDAGQIPDADAKKMADSAFQVTRDDLDKFLKYWNQKTHHYRCGILRIRTPIGGDFN